MNFQLEIQARGLETDDAVEMAEAVAAIVSATVNEDIDHFYVALVRKPEGAEVAA